MDFSDGKKNHVHKIPIFYWHASVMSWTCNAVATATLYGDELRRQTCAGLKFGSHSYSTHPTNLANGSMLNVYVMRIIIRWSLHVSDKCTIFYLICIGVICGHSDFGHMWHMTRHTVNRPRQHQHERMKSDKWNTASQSTQLSTHPQLRSTSSDG